MINGILFPHDLAQLTAVTTDKRMYHKTKHFQIALPVRETRKMTWQGAMPACISWHCTWQYNGKAGHMQVAQAFLQHEFLIDHAGLFSKAIKVPKADTVRQELGGLVRASAISPHIVSVNSQC